MSSPQATAVGRRPLRAAVPALLLVLGACTDGLIGPAAPAPVLPDAGLQPLQCSASLRGGTVDCRPILPSGAAARQLIGGQDVNVRLTSSNVAYTGVDSIFAFDVTIQNLLPEAIGTADGVNPHPNGVRVFFNNGIAVTSGAGSATVDNADDLGAFTGSGQPYFQYDGILRTNEVSQSRRWELKVDPTVATFSFVLYIQTELQPLLVINELMANPGGAVQDSVGEYVEVYNAGRFPVQMQGMVVSDNGGSHTIASSVIVPGGGYALLGRSANTAVNGGISPDYVYSPNSTSTTLQFSNSGAERFVIRTGGGVTVDSVAYTNTSLVAAAGRARELVNPSLDNTLVDGSNWANASSTYATSNLGTPRQPNGNGTPLPEAGPPFTVVISPATATVTLGNTQQLSAVARDTLSQVTATTFTWTTLDAGVATVSGTGLVSTVSVGTARIVATASNGVADTATITVQAAAAIDYRNHVEFGTPTDADSSDDILLSKTQFVVSYSPVRGGPNWVAWNLNATHFGPADRCDCFEPDAQLPVGVYRVVTSDYTGSGYSRGHMVMSAQRTVNAQENAVTFLMTNILPQIQDMNGGPWLQFEVQNNDLARISNKELYIYAGGMYPASPSTLNGAGRVQIPTSTWKIVVEMDRGEGLANVATAADIRVYAVNMPNQSGIQSQPWTNYRTTVDAIEAATGYDFLAALPDAIETVVEAALSN